MPTLSIYTLTSALHDAKAIDTITNEFLSSLGIGFTMRGADFSDYGSAFSVIYVRTGGTEGLFARLFPTLRSMSRQPFYLLTSGKSNSLAASMEILSYLRQHGESGEIIHGSPALVSHRLSMLSNAYAVRRSLCGMRLGVIGQPSDWLISSQADDAIVRERTGIELVHIEMDELTGAIRSLPAEAIRTSQESAFAHPGNSLDLNGAEAIYLGLKKVVAEHGLQGFTLRCFDLLTSVRNTGCLALARLNAEGIVSGCEGDVPTLLTMAFVKSLTGFSGFQANPARIDPEHGELVFAHCTIPLDMVSRYELDTHFESGIGVGIRGYMDEGGVSIVKVSADLSRHFVAEGTLVRNLSEPDLCRTQQVVRLDNAGDASYFLTHPIGNHHVVVAGRWKEQLEAVIEARI